MRIRAQCQCKCIPYGEKCGEECGGGQCDQDGVCVDALQLDEKNERIRKTCNGKCIPWDQDCGGK